MLLPPGPFLAGVPFFLASFAIRMLALIGMLYDIMSEGYSGNESTSRVRSPAARAAGAGPANGAPAKLEVEAPGEPGRRARSRQPGQEGRSQPRSGSQRPAAPCKPAGPSGR